MFRSLLFGLFVLVSLSDPLLLSSSKSQLYCHQTLSHFVMFAIVYNNDHINYVVTVLRSTLHIKELKKVPKFSTLQL